MCVGWRESTFWGSKQENGYFPVGSKQPLQAGGADDWWKSWATAEVGFCNGICAWRDQVHHGSCPQSDRVAAYFIQPDGRRKENIICVVIKRQFHIDNALKVKNSFLTPTIIKLWCVCVSWWKITGGMNKLQTILVSLAPATNLWTRCSVFVVWPPSTLSHTTISPNDTDITNLPHQERLL